MGNDRFNHRTPLKPLNNERFNDGTPQKSQMLTEHQSQYQAHPPSQPDVEPQYQPTAIARQENHS